MLEELEDKPEAVAARLIWLREQMNMNKNEFSTRAGVDEQSYGQVEKCNRTLTYGAAKKIRRTYGVSLEFLYFGKIDDLPHRLTKLL